jgi:hypothetical protein
MSAIHDRALHVNKNPLLIPPVRERGWRRRRLRSPMELLLLVWQGRTLA